MPVPHVNTAAPTGVWRPVVARRQALHDTADALVTAAWQAETANLSLAPAVRAFRAAVGETVTASQRSRRQAATAAVLALLARRAWRRLRAAIAEAVQRARAAGYAAGTALLTQDADDDGDYSDTPPDNPFTNVGLSDEQAADSAQRILAAALAAVAARVGRAMADGGDSDRILADAYDLLLAIDLAVSAAYGAGLLAAYIGSGVQALAWITAGDSEVCARCDTAAQNGPYSPLAAPPLPMHPRCRCLLAPI